ncbi:right-handed parallel beta-helix repeat-containing protein [Streptomyces sp. CB01881]|uniref:right-handed parallel beta-helix repeat-containing protein n=1 Tax=Streptomyces sp. CB01881 TaxID=2078691 RepID=UPI000CDC75B0|nr:right-handed parallel beta-helix repeat-containing protein [Streptomyces sp. CB01881]AUY49737.1 hypothetical protein C2142_13290 [Streptomyces sp. CB01881]TYC73127.1 hypothetical protein EH183_13285 [Streptomyces sp. CB01881]
MALVAGATMIGAIGLPAGLSTASATPATLYVNNRPGAACTDSGTGAQAAPYCTVGAAAAVAQPGQTVEIQPGTYRESLVLTRSGTAEAPITFRSGGGGDSLAAIGMGSAPDTGVTVRGASHIRFESLLVEPNIDKGVLLVDGGHDVSFSRVTTNGAVHVTGGSSQVVYAGGTVAAVRGQSPFTVDGGSTGTVLTTNGINSDSYGPATGILVEDAPGTVVVSNSVHSWCFPALALNGGSSGAVVENNVVSTARSGEPCGNDAARATGITVAQGATAGTKVDYNVVDPSSGAAAYSWAGTAFTAQPAFTAASGQGAHDFVAPPWVPKGPDAPVNHTIDSADENAPWMLPADQYGMAAVDNPTVPNTGTGTGFRDRGAYENPDFGSLFTPAGPTRLLDTRTGVGGPAQAVPAWGTVDLPVTGLAGVPASGVTAVTMNVTVTEPGQDGHLTVYPHGDQAPDASNLNWTAGRTIANLVTVPVKDGRVSFYNASGASVQLIADLAGYYGPKGDFFHPQGPTRLLDTRTGVGGPAQAVPAWGTVDLPVTGLAGVPASGVTAVTMNVTVTEPGQDGHLTVYPHGDQAPDASNLNWTAGRTIANLVTVPVKDGRVSFYNASGASVQLIADLAGYYTAEGKLTYSPNGPTRKLDTRGPGGPVPAWGTVVVDLADVAGIGAATLNVTVIEPGADGHLTVYPHGGAAPDASNINFVRGETIPNQVVVPVKDGKVSFYNASDGPVHLAVDLFGYQAY